MFNQIKKSGSHDRFFFAWYFTTKQLFCKLIHVCWVILQWNYLLNAFLHHICSQKDSYFTLLSRFCVCSVKELCSPNACSYHCCQFNQQVFVHRTNRNTLEWSSWSQITKCGMLPTLTRPDILSGGSWECLGHTGRPWQNPLSWTPLQSSWKGKPGVWFTVLNDLLILYSISCAFKYLTECKLKITIKRQFFSEIQSLVEFNLVMMLILHNLYIFTWLPI